MSVWGRLKLALQGQPPAPSERPARMQIGEVASGLAVLAGIPEIDYLDALAYPEYLHEFKKVANDPQVSKELTANVLPIVGAEWKIEPASDDPENVDIAEFVAANVLNETGDTYGRQYWQKTPWRARLRDILRFLQNGFAVFQKIYRLEGRFWVIDRIKYLTPESIQRWYFDEKDDLAYLLRTYRDATGKPHTLERIDAKDLVIYTWDQEGSNILGKPLIRPMWGPYRIKSMLEKLEVVDKQKTAVGVPFFKLQAEPTSEDERRAEELLKSMRTGNLERSYAVIKDGQDFGWKEGGNANKGMREIVAGKEYQISKVGGATLTEIDSSHSGWSGTAGAKGAFEAGLHTSIAQSVAEQEQRNVIELCDMNFEGLIDYPTIRVSRIDPFEQTRTIPEFVAAITAGAVTADLDTENEIRRRYGFMEREDGSAPPPGPAKVKGVGAGGDGTPANRPNQAPDPGASLSRRRARVVAGKRKSGRSAEAVARAKVEADRVRTQLEQFQSVYLHALRSVLQDMRTALVEAVAQGRLSPTKPADVRVPFVNDLRDRLLSILRSVRDFGRDELKGELARQLTTSKIRLQGDPTNRTGAIAYANHQAEVLVELDVTQLVQRLQSQATAIYNRLVSQGLSTEDLIAAFQKELGGYSDRPLELAARSAPSTMFNEGRSIAIQELQPGLHPFVIRTSVMDPETTCSIEDPGGDGIDRCWELDGKTIEIDSPDYRLYQPPAFCLGGAQCQCIYVAFPAAGTGA